MGWLEIQPLQQGLPKDANYIAKAAVVFEPASYFYLQSKREDSNNLCGKQASKQSSYSSN